MQQQRLALEAQREEWEKWKKEERDKMVRRVEDERKRLAEERAKFEAERRKHAEEWKKRETPELKVLNSKVSAKRGYGRNSYFCRPQQGNIYICFM